MVSLVACVLVPSHINDLDHLPDEPRPFEQLDIVFIGIGLNLVTLPVTDWRDDEDVLQCPVPDKFFHSSRGWPAGEVQQRPVLLAHGKWLGVPALDLAHDAFLVFAGVMVSNYRRKVLNGIIAPLAELTDAIGIASVDLQILALRGQ
jgi:hypothetical protein